MKLGTYLLIAVLIAGFIFRCYNLRHEFFIDNDSFLHASVIRQMLSGGSLTNYALSFNNPLILEPLGFYLVTLIPAFLTGLIPAFLFTPLFFGMITLVFFYLVLKELFSPRVALIACLILAFSVAHFYRSSPNTYRGDNFFLASFMIVLYLLITKKHLLAGVILGLSSALWNGYALSVLIIVSSLIIELTLKFLKNDFSKELVINSLKLIIPYFIIELLFLQLGIIHPLFFTSNMMIHSLIVFAPIITGVFYLIFGKVRNKSLILALMSASFIAVLLLNVSVIQSIINQALFETSVLFKVGVSELLPPTPEVLNIMLSWSFYLLWPGLLMLVFLTVKKPSLAPWLVWSVVSVYLMMSYSRYVFIASVTAASLTALVLNAFKGNKQVFGAVIIIFFVPFINDSLSNVNLVGPRMNNDWFSALNHLSTLDEGLVLTWWDHGSWVQYYTGFPAVVDSVNGQDEGRIHRIASWLMSDNFDDFSDWNVTYLVLGSDVMYYSDAIFKIGNITGLEVSMVNYCTPVDDVIKCPTSDGLFEVYPDGTLYRYGESISLINKTLIANRNGVSEVVSESGNNCLVINQPYINLFINDKACNTNYAKLMYGNGLSGFELIYRNDGVVIYRVV